MAQQLYITKGGPRPAPVIPLDAVTRTFGIFGQRGTGKTNTAVVMAEEMCRKGGHAAIFDPVGAWWGITRAGEGKGLPGIVIGGEHGDVPLEETGGQLVAELIIARHWPVVVVDMKLLRKGAQLRFLADCLEALYFGNRLPLHVFFEEADRALPQSPRGMDPTMGRVLGAAEDIFKLGRGRGLGSTLVSQRFATVNKNVTEQVETMILHRMIGPNDRKAAKAWIESNGDPALTERVLNAMAKQKLGEAVLYSPGWLDIFETIRVRERKTFDSSATPEVGAQLVEPTKRAPVDLDALRTAMEETIERAKANDPAELRRRIAELEDELKGAYGSMAQPVETTILVPDRDAVTKLSEAVAEMDSFVRDFGEQVAEAVAKVDVVREVKGEAVQVLADMSDVLDRVGGLPPKTQVGSAPTAPEGSGERGPSRAAPAGRGKPASAPSRPAAASSNGHVELTGPQLRVLAALEWLEAVGFTQPTKIQIGFIAGYRVGKKVGGTFGNVLGQLRAEGMIDYPAQGYVALTVEGRGVAMIPPIERTTRGLQAAVMERLADPERRVLQAVLDAYPREVSKQEVGAAAGYSVGEKVGGTFGNILGRLRSLGLIDYPRQGYVRAESVLFLD